MSPWRPRSAVDLVGALNLVATLTSYLSLAPLAPAAVAVGYGESPWPFLGATAIVGGLAQLVVWLTRGDHRIGAREG
ncbi:MAG: TrkH family potassium uptake protein, partial [Gaiellaceae bacterium]